MEEIKDFAAIVRASNGQQVLFYKESEIYSPNGSISYFLL